MKEMLGIGIAFEGIDKGLSRDLDSLMGRTRNFTKQVDTLRDSLRESSKAGVGLRKVALPQVSQIQQPPKPVLPQVELPKVIKLPYPPVKMDFPEPFRFPASDIVTVEKPKPMRITTADVAEFVPKKPRLVRQEDVARFVGPTDPRKIELYELVKPTELEKAWAGMRANVQSVATDLGKAVLGAQRFDAVVKAWKGPVAQAAPATPAVGGLGTIGKQASAATGKVGRLGAVFQALTGKISGAKEGAGGLFGMVTNFFKGGVLAGLGKAMQVAFGNQEVAEFSKQFDTLNQRMTFIYGKGSSALANYQKQIKEGVQLGVTLDQANTITSTFNQFGVNVSKATGSVRLLQEAVGVLGYDAGEFSEAFAGALQTLRLSDSQMQNLVETSSALGQAYGVVDSLKVLPSIIDSARKASLRLGILDPKKNLALVKTLTTMTLQFQKIGMSQAQAASASANFQSNVEDLQESVTRMRLGLGGSTDKIFELTSQLGRFGVNQADVVNTLASGNTQSINDMFKRIGSGLKEGSDDMAAFRLIVKDALGPEAAALFGDFGNRVAAETQKANAALAGIDPAKSLKTQIGLQKDTIDFSERRRKASEDLFKLEKDMANRDPLIAANNAAAESYLKLARAVADPTSRMGEMFREADRLNKTGLAGLLEKFGLSRQAASDLAVTIEELTKTFAPLGLLFSGLGSMILGPLGYVVKKVVELSGTILGKFGKQIPDAISKTKDVFKGITNIFAKAFGGITKGLSVAGKVVGRFALRSLPLIGTAVTTVMDGLEGYKERGGIGGALTGVLIGSDTKGKGLGARIGDVASNAMKYAGIGAIIGSFVPGIGTAIGGALGGVLGGAVSIVKQAIEQWGPAIGDAVGTAWNWAKEKIGAGIAWLGDRLGGLKDFIGDKLAAAWSGLKDIAKNIDFGGMVDSVKKYFSETNFGQIILDGLTWPFRKWWEYVSNIASNAAGLFKSFFGKDDAQAEIDASVRKYRESMATSAPTASERLVTPATLQPGATQAAATIVQPLTAEERAAPDGVITAIERMQATLADLLGRQAPQPVVVRLEGDARQIFRVMNNDAMDRAGAAGLGSAYGPGARR